MPNMNIALNIFSWISAVRKYNINVEEIVSIKRHDVCDNSFHQAQEFFCSPIYIVHMYVTFAISLFYQSWRIQLHRRGMIEWHDKEKLSSQDECMTKKWYCHSNINSYLIRFWITHKFHYHRHHQHLQYLLFY